MCQFCGKASSQNVSRSGNDKSKGCKNCNNNSCNGCNGVIRAVVPVTSNLNQPSSQVVRSMNVCSNKVEANGKCKDTRCAKVHPKKGECVICVTGTCSIVKERRSERCPSGMLCMKGKQMTVPSRPLSKEEREKYYDDNGKVKFIRMCEFSRESHTRCYGKDQGKFCLLGKQGKCPKYHPVEDQVYWDSVCSKGNKCEKKGCMMTHPKDIYPEDYEDYCVEVDVEDKTKYTIVLKEEFVKCSPACRHYVMTEGKRIYICRRSYESHLHCDFGMNCDKILRGKCEYYHPESHKKHVLQMIEENSTKKQEIPLLIAMPVIDTLTGEYMVVRLIKTAGGLKAEEIGQVTCTYLDKSREVQVEKDTLKLFRCEGARLHISGVCVAGIRGDKDKKMKTLERHYIGETFIAQNRTGETNCELLSKYSFGLLDEVEYIGEKDQEIVFDELSIEEIDDDIENDDWKSNFKSDIEMLNETDKLGKTKALVKIFLEEIPCGKNTKKVTKVEGVVSEDLLKLAKTSFGCCGKMNADGFELKGDFRTRLLELLVSNGYGRSSIVVEKTKMEELEEL